MTSGSTSNSVVDSRSDIELIVDTRDGDQGAYGELYRRHHDAAARAARAMTRSRSDAEDIVAEAFARVLRALLAGRGPDVAFRPYLLTTVRHACIDRADRHTNETLTGTIAETIEFHLSSRPTAANDDQSDRAMALRAFGRLPERWQTVLWHLDVEGESVPDLAVRMKLAPNALSALANRAREGLRQEFINTHVAATTAEACFECRQSLGGYVRSRLSNREQNRVERHLQRCARCSALLPEIIEVNQLLRNLLVPALVGITPRAFLSAPLRWPWSDGSKSRRTTLASSAAASVLVIAAIAAAVMSTTPDATLTAPTPQDPPAVTTNREAPTSRGNDRSSRATSTSPLADPTAPSVMSSEQRGDQSSVQPTTTGSSGTDRNLSSEVTPRGPGIAQPTTKPPLPAAPPKTTQPGPAPLEPTTSSTASSEPPSAAPPSTHPLGSGTSATTPSIGPMTNEPSPTPSATTTSSTASSTTRDPSSTDPASTDPSSTVLSDEITQITIRPRSARAGERIIEEVLLEAATVLVRIDAVSSWRLEDTGKWSCRQVNNATWQCSTNGQQSTVLVFSARDQQAEPPRDDS